MQSFESIKIVNISKRRLAKNFSAGKIGTAELLALEFFDRRFKIPYFNLGWRRSASRLANNAGFFPITYKSFTQWNHEMRYAISHQDYICAWQSDPFLKTYEKALLQDLCPNVSFITHELLSKNAFSFCEGLRMLIISPFVSTMKLQLTKLRSIHDPEGKKSLNWEVLQSQCRFLQCPLHWHLSPSPYRSWFHGLEELEKAALSQEFDVALVGAGAWSLPLAARIKKAGRSAIHTGGETQLLFGIKGKRWDDYGFYNSAWVSLRRHEAPPGLERVDDGCYW